MSKKHAPQYRVLNRAIMLRVTEEEHKLFSQCADDDQRSLSSWARVRLLGVALAEKEEAKSR